MKRDPEKVQGQARQWYAKVTKYAFFSSKNDKNDFFYSAFPC